MDGTNETKFKAWVVWCEYSEIIKVFANDREEAERYKQKLCELDIGRVEILTICEAFQRIEGNKSRGRLMGQVIDLFAYS